MTRFVCCVKEFELRREDSSVLARVVAQLGLHYGNTTLAVGIVEGMSP